MTEPISLAGVGKQTVTPEKRKAMLEQMAAEGEKARVAGAHQVPSQPPPPAPPAEAAKPTADAVTPTGLSDSTGSIRKSNCDHCGWALDVPVAANPTDKDKEDYLLCFRDGVPFTKQFSLMRDRVRITFHDLSPGDAAMCRRQVDRDTTLGRVPDAFSWAATVIEYRMCLALQRIERNGQPPIDFPDTKNYSDFIADEEPVYTIHIHIRDRIIKQATLWNNCVNTFQEFQRLVQMFEARAYDPNFWPAAAG